MPFKSNRINTAKAMGGREYFWIHTLPTLSLRVQTATLEVFSARDGPPNGSLFEENIRK
jgi:hypothetical protein